MNDFIALYIYQLLAAACHRGGRIRGEAFNYFCSAVLYDNLQEFGQAVLCYQKHLALCRQSGDRVGELLSCNAIGVALQLQGLGIYCWWSSVVVIWPIFYLLFVFRKSYCCCTQNIIQNIPNWQSHFINNTWNHLHWKTSLWPTLILGLFIHHWYNDEHLYFIFNSIYLSVCDLFNCYLFAVPSSAICNPTSACFAICNSAWRRGSSIRGDWKSGCHRVQSTWLRYGQGLKWVCLLLSNYTCNSASHHVGCSSNVQACMERYLELSSTLHDTQGLTNAHHSLGQIAHEQVPNIFTILSSGYPYSACLSVRFVFLLWVK